MTRLMYDAVSAGNIPADAVMVAGYVDGNYAWSDADWARFPHAVKLKIAVFATTVADILDVEQGNDMHPDHWVSWAKLVRSHGKTPIIYMNYTTWQSVKDAFTSRGVEQPLYWVAQYDGDDKIPNGAVGKQYQGGETDPYDLSVVLDHVSGIDSPVNVPVDPPTPVEEDEEMTQIESLAVKADGEYVFAFGKGRYKEVAFVTDVFADAPAKLRVVFWLTSGPVVHDSVQIKSGSTVLTFGASAPNCFGVTVKREDAGKHPVGVCLA